MEERCLHRPLLPVASRLAATETTSIANSFVGLPSNDDDDKIVSSKLGVYTRLVLLFLIGLISIWANHEASKGFVIMVTNNMEGTPVGKKFNLFYAANDEAIRLVQSCSDFASKALFPNDNSKPGKLIDQVELQLVSHNLTTDHTIAVKFFGQQNKYTLSINPNVMEFDDFKHRIRKEIQRGMAEILLFQKRGKAPMTLLDGMAEYINISAGFGGRKPVKLRGSSEKCWEDEDPRVVAKVLAYYEKKSRGFVGRLNQEMNTDEWYEKMMDGILGMQAIHLCEEFHNSMIQNEDMIY